MTVAAQNSEMDLSVIIVCRDAMRYLPHCIEAVQPLMLQGELRTECLVVDMGSEDETPEYLAAEQNSWHISGYVSEPYENRYDAMNKGLGMAKGKVCLFLTPESEVMVENTAACCAPILNGEVDCVFSSAIQVNPSNGQARPLTPHTDHLFLRTPCHLQSFFCSASLLRRLGGFRRQQYPVLADCDFMHRALEAECRYRVAPLSTCRHYYRPAGESEDFHVDFLRFIASHAEEILVQCRQHPSYAIRAVHEILRHAVRCDWPVKGDVLKALDDLLARLRSVIKPTVREKICRRLRRRAVLQGLLLPFKGWRRVRVTLKLCRSHLHVARILSSL